MGKVKAKQKSSFRERQRPYWPFLDRIQAELKKTGSGNHPKPRTTSSRCKESEDSNGLQHKFLKLLIELNQMPESLEFRTPVDPKAQGIPNYLKVIKNPMDLSTMGQKLEGGFYSDTWNFVDDIWLMLGNAWSFNASCSTVYHHTTKLAEFMESRLTSAMTQAGYCCGRSYSFEPRTLYCSLKEGCEIGGDQSYFLHKNFAICHKCYWRAAKDSSTIQLFAGDQDEALVVPIGEFEEKKNNDIGREPWLNCISGCGRKVHQICALVVDPQTFVCPSCSKTESLKSFHAFDLPETTLSTFVETFVKKNVNSGWEVEGNIIIRTLSSAQKLFKLRSEMERRYVLTGEMEEAFPYRQKVVLAFQTLEGVEVLLFVMHAQEYDEDCPEPNCRRIYISYLDSVHFFQPKELRTELYHQIILGYLEFTKRRGFRTAHIWASPSPPGKDYILHRHPSQQKIPTAQRLIGWYRDLLNKGVRNGIIEKFHNIWDEPNGGGNIQSPVQMPYFDGDFWPDFFESEIVKLREKPTALDISTRMVEAMKQQKNEFFIIHLSSMASSQISSLSDPDPVLECEILERETFLRFEKQHNFEFSTLRRAKFSSKAVVFEMAKQLGLVSGSEADNYNGGEGASGGRRQGESSPNQNDSVMQAYMKLITEKYAHNLTHAYNCKDANCKELPTCLKFKGILTHISVCGNHEICMDCKKLLSFVKKHSESCEQGENCPVPYCYRIKLKLRPEPELNDDKEEPPRQQAAPSRGWEVGVATELKNIMGNQSGSHQTVIDLLRRKRPRSLLPAFRAP